MCRFAAALQIIPEEVVSGRPAEAILTITESTSFRQIGHLSLRLRPLSDQQMKKYLAEVVQRYRVTPKQPHLGHFLLV